MADRTVRLLARAARQGWFRSVEVSGMERIPREGPTLVVANHPGGFVDPVLLLSTWPRNPRFLAMGTLFRPPLGWLLRFAGAIPIHRRMDGATGANVSSFAACYDVLVAGGVVGIFPEGEASDEPHLLPVKTGAARIALGARARGAAGLRIVPAGLIYEDKGSARGRAFVRIGVPIELDAVPADAAEEDREAVEALTGAVESHLAEASLNYRDAAQAADLFFAATVALRRTGGNPAWAPALSALEELSGHLAAAPPAQQAAVREAATAYRAALEANDADDRVVSAGTAPRPRAARIAGGFLTLLAVPFAAVGAVVNALPALAVHLAGRRPAPPVRLATIKFLVGFALFPVDWLILRYVVLDGVVHPWVWTIALGPLCGLVAAVVGDRIRRIRLARLRPERMLVPDRAVEDLAERRAWLVEEVAAALETAGRSADTAGSLVDRP